MTQEPAPEEKPQPAKMGRPTGYSKEVAEKICEELLKPRSLRSICSDEDMPGISTVMQWLIKFPDFAEQYTRTRKIQTDVVAEETFGIVDDGANDYMEVERRDGSTVEVVNAEVIARSRLRFDQRRWWLSKMNPKKYGDKIEVEDGPERTNTLNAFLGNIRKGEDAE